MKKNILFFCGSPPHPLHKIFAKSINSNFYYFPDNSNFFRKIIALFKIPKNYDFYFTEGLYNYIPLIKILVNKKAKFINLFSDPRLYQIINNQKFDFKSEKIKKYSKIRKKLTKINLGFLNGAICIGDFQTSLLKKINRKIPFEKVNVFIEREEFFGYKANLNKNNILFIGNGPDYYYKGLDILIKIFKKINQINSKLFIIGSGWEKFRKKYSKEKNIIFLGKKNSQEMKEYIYKSSLYCHFGRGEAFGVTILEAMASGLPCIVSNLTGAKEVVKKVDKNFVVDLKKEDKIIETIKNYFKKSNQEKLKIGRNCKKVVKKFKEELSVNLFKKRFRLLLNKID